MLAINLALLFTGCSQDVSNKDKEKNIQPPVVSPQVAKNARTITDKNPELSTFIEAIEVAGLANIFEGTGPYTAFMPTNEAFNKFGKDKLNVLMQPENQDKLTEILLFHIAPGKYMKRSLKTMDLKTVNAKNLDIVVENDEIKVNNAKVIKTDIVGPNGVIHELDTVLMP